MYRYGNDRQVLCKNGERALCKDKMKRERKCGLLTVRGDYQSLDVKKKKKKNKQLKKIPAYK